MEFGTTNFNKRSPDRFLYAYELTEAIQNMLTALTKLNNDATSIVATYGPQNQTPPPPVPAAWNNITLAKVSTINNALGDAIKLGVLSQSLISSMTSVLSTSVEASRIDVMLQQIITLAQFSFASPASFASFTTRVASAVADYDSSMPANPTPANLSAKALVDSYPATVAAATRSADFLGLILKKIQDDSAAVILWANTYPDGNVQTMPPALQNLWQQGCCIHTTYSNSLNAVPSSMT